MTYTISNLAGGDLRTFRLVRGLVGELERLLLGMLGCQTAPLTSGRSVGRGEPMTAPLTDETITAARIEHLAARLAGLANDARYWNLRRTYGDYSAEVLSHLECCARVQRLQEVRQ